jgi:CheY-like chemotaxis protein
VADERREAILCVDDEVIILLALKQEIKRRYGARYAVETAADPERAIEAVRGLDAEGVRTALVVTDWMMPGMRGDRLVLSLREIWPGIKSILLTGLPDEASAREVRNAALFDAFVPKPWRPAELYAAIDGCLGG